MISESPLEMMKCSMWSPSSLPSSLTWSNHASTPGRTPASSPTRRSPRRIGWSPFRLIQHQLHRRGPSPSPPSGQARSPFPRRRRLHPQIGNEGVLLHRPGRQRLVKIIHDRNRRPVVHVKRVYPGKLTGQEQTVVNCFLCITRPCRICSKLQQPPRWRNSPHESRCSLRRSSEWSSTRRTTWWVLKIQPANPEKLYLKYPICQTLSGTLSRSQFCELLSISDDTDPKSGLLR